MFDIRIHSAGNKPKIVFNNSVELIGFVIYPAEPRLCASSLLSSKPKAVSITTGIVEIVLFLFIFDKME